ncbi:hypothetical protein NSQ77_04100 [Oceanobacillus sp. FSL K6-2867]
MSSSYVFTLMNQSVVNDFIMSDPDEDKVKEDAIVLNHGKGFAPQ